MVSTYNLIILTVERYIEIVHPIFHKISMGPMQIYIAMVCSWLIGFGYNLFLTGLTSGVNECGECQLMTNWPSELASGAAGVLTFVLQFVLPLVLMVICYSKIAWKLKSRPRPGGTAATNGVNNNDADGASNPKTDMMSRARRNVIKTVFIVCMCFVACWIGNQVFFLLYNIGYEVSFTSWFYHFTVYAAFINCCINPFIYIAQLNAFRNQARKLLGCPQGRVGTDSSTVNTVSQAGWYPAMFFSFMTKKTFQESTRQMTHFFVDCFSMHVPNRDLLSSSIRHCHCSCVKRCHMDAVDSTFCLDLTEHKTREFNTTDESRIWYWNWCFAQIFHASIESVPGMHVAVE